MLLSFFAVAGMYAMEGEHVDTVSEAKVKLDKARAENNRAIKEAVDYKESVSKLHEDYHATSEHDKIEVAKLKSWRDGEEGKENGITHRIERSRATLEQAIKNHEAAKAREKLQKEADAKKASDVSEGMFESLAPEAAPEVALKPGEEKLSEEDKQVAIKMKTEIFDKINNIKGLQENGIDFSSVSDVLDRITKAGKMTPQDRADIGDAQLKAALLMEKLLAEPTGKLKASLSKEDVVSLNKVIDSMNEVEESMDGGGEITPEDQARVLNQTPEELVASLKTASIGKSILSAFKFILNCVATVFLVIAIFATLPISLTVLAVIKVRASLRSSESSDSDHYLSMNPAIGS